MDVIGFGALNYDRFRIVERVPKKGEEIAAKDSRGEAGGSAANTIVGLARLGHKTGFMGILGEDSEGTYIWESFEKEKVDTRGIARSNAAPTGTVWAYIDAAGERTLIPYSGVNDHLKKEDIDINYAKRAKFLHMSSFVKKKQLGLHKYLIKQISKIEEKNIRSKIVPPKISFSPGMLYARRSLNELKPIIKGSYIIFLSEEEIRLLTGENYGEGGKILINMGAKLVSVTLGVKGSFITDGKKEYLIDANHVNKVVDTTGAGDAYAAGFLHGLLTSRDIYSCGVLGNIVSSYSIKHFGCRIGLPRRDTIRKDFAKYNKKKKKSRNTLNQKKFEIINSNKKSSRFKLF